MDAGGFEDGGGTQGELNGGLELPPDIEDLPLDILADPRLIEDLPPDIEELPLDILADPLLIEELPPDIEELPLDILAEPLLEDLPLLPSPHLHAKPCQLDCGQLSSAGFDGGEADGNGLLGPTHCHHAHDETANGFDDDDANPRRNIAADDELGIEELLNSIHLYYAAPGNGLLADGNNIMGANIGSAYG